MNNLRGSFSILILLASVLGCKKEDAEPTQILLNNDVESGNKTPDFWWYGTGLTDNPYEFLWSDNESSSGSKSLKISVQTEQLSNLAFWEQTIKADMAVGKSVTLKVRIKGNLSGRGTSIAIRGDDTGQATGAAEQFVSTEGNVTINGNFDWKEYSVKLDKVASSTQSLTIFLIFQPGTTGEVYFDDASLSY